MGTYRRGEDEVVEAAGVGGVIHVQDPSGTRLEPYAEAARTWLHREAKVVDTTHLTAAQAALEIANAVTC